MTFGEKYGRMKDRTDQKERVLLIVKLNPADEGASACSKVYLLSVG